MSTSFWLDRSREKPTKSYDVVILGAGISGLSTAFWLNQEDPSLKIAIVEKNRLGFGASGRNAGFITCGSVEHFGRMMHKHGKDEALQIWRFSEKNLSLLKEHIIQDRSQEIHLNDKGTFSLAATPAEYEELKHNAMLMRENDINIEFIEQNDILKRVGASNFVGGIKYLDDASVNPTKLLQLMREKISVDLHEQTECYAIGEADGGTRHVLTDNGTFEAQIVIMCLNGYSPSIHPYFKDKIFPTRGQILVMETVPKFMEGPCYANFYLDYFRQLETGEMLIGGFRQLEKETETGYSDHITDVIQNALYSFIQEHLPALKEKKTLYQWGGVMGFSRDGQPLVGSLPEDNQIFFIGGYTGHGLGLAFHGTKCLVDSIFGRDIPKFLSARRF